MQGWGTGLQGRGREGHGAVQGRGMSSILTAVYNYTRNYHKTESPGLSKNPCHPARKEWADADADMEPVSLYTVKTKINRAE